MPFKFVIFATDALIYLLLIISFLFLLWARNHGHLRESWQQIIRKPLSTVSLVILFAYILIGVIDSVHFRPALSQQANGKTEYAPYTKSLLDLLLAPLDENDEATFSAPFATHLYNKQTYTLENGQLVYGYPPLRYAGKHLQQLKRTKTTDIFIRALTGIAQGLFIWLCLGLGVKFFLLIRKKTPENFASQRLKKNISPLMVTWLTLGFLILITSIAFALAQEYHILGTDKVGQDVLYLTIKSIRTGLVIGTLTTLVMLPFAILLGTLAGYFGGIIDDIIQYLYTTLSSIPGVLLIAASILSLQIFFANHPELFKTLAARADARLLALCIILGFTSWTNLCRLLRGETLKLREMDYIQAAHALGVGHFRTIVDHIIPNLVHIILITIVLDFSSLVLAEAVLSYVGVGVDPTTLSWGNMINSARLELAREPVVWWPLLAAFIFMFILVLAANFFADAVRDVFDPRLHER